MKRIIIITTILLSFSFISFAQDASHSPHEVSAWISGPNKMIYKTSEHIDSKKMKFGASLGLGYAYHINSHIAVLSGLEYSMYNTDLEVNYLYNKYLTKDNTGEALTYRGIINKGVEEQKISYLQIPIMAQYTVSIGKSHSYYVSGGMKFGFATGKKYKFKADKLTTLGEYEYSGSTINDRPEQGFGEYENVKREGSLALNMSVMLALETGFKWSLGSKMYLYTGAYFDYGLNNISKTHSSHNTFIGYNSTDPSQPIINSLAKSSFNNMLENTPFIEKMRPMAIGIKLKFAFKL